MKKLIIVIVLLWIIYYLAQYIMGQVFINGLPATIMLTSGNEIEEEIVTYYKSILSLDQNSLGTGEYEIKSTYIDVNNDKRKDLIVVLDSRFSCGTEGCIATLFIQNENKDFVPIPFFYAVTDIKPLDTFTNQMRDLVIDDDANQILIWNGNNYEPLISS